jgi:choline-glycine betaine transporter
MLKDQRFWVGVIIGFVLYFIYSKYASKKLGG